MPIFVDTSDLNELRDCVAMGLCAGVTTNPLIITREAPGVDLRARILDIIEIARAPVSVELTRESEKEMLEEARGYRAWDPEHIVIKVPMGEVGLRVTRALESAGAPVNVTCVMAFNQAYLAAHAGASYVSIFSGRVKDMGYDPAPIIARTREAIERERWKTQIIVGSIRHLHDVNSALEAGAHIVTVPPPILKKMCWNPRTIDTVREFNQAWRDRGGPK
jgi:transaldolase